MRRSRSSAIRLAVAAVLIAGLAVSGCGGHGRKAGVVYPHHRNFVRVNAGTGNDTTCRRSSLAKPCATQAKACTLARSIDLIQTVSGGLVSSVRKAVACAGPPANWFVSATGSNANSGTDAAHPFATLSKAYQVASCAQVVQLSGTFTAAETIFEVRHNCSNGTYITYQGPATFTGATGAVLGANGALNIQTADIRLTNVTFQESTTSGASCCDAGLYVVSSCGTTYSAQNIKVDHIAGTRYVAASVKNVIFSNNTWNYIDDWGTGGSHVYPKGGCANSTDYPGDTIGFEDTLSTWQQSLPGSNCQSRNGGAPCHLDCLVLASASAAGANAGDSLHVHRDTFKQCNDIDVWWKLVAATGAGTTLSGMLLENNDEQASVAGSATTELNCPDLSGDLVQNSAFRYNSLQASSAFTVGTANCTFSNVKVVGNIMQNDSGCGTTGITFNKNVVVSGACAGDTTVAGIAALYVNNAGMDLHLANGSAAISAGDTGYFPALDFDGNGRPIGTVDAGAHERS